MSLEVKVRAKRIKELVVKRYFNAVTRTRTMLFIGPPGTGKSASVQEAAGEIAERLGREFVEYDELRFDEIVENPEKYFVFCDFRMTECEPSDLLGIPRDHPKHFVTAYKPLGWAFALSRCPGLLFLDELPNVARDDVFAAAYKIVYDRRAGFVRFHDGVMIVSAGNPPEYSSIARDLPDPLKDRCFILYVDIPTLEEWQEWMNGKYGTEGWDFRVFGYLKKCPSDFFAYPKNYTGREKFPTPRAWTRVATELPLAENEAEMTEIAVGWLGEEYGLKFATFLRKEVPEPEKLLKNPGLWDKLDLDQKYAAAALVAQYLQRQVKEKGRRADLVTREAKNFFAHVARNDTRDHVILLLVMIPDDQVKITIASRLAAQIPEIKETIRELLQLRAKYGV